MRSRALKTLIRKELQEHWRSARDGIGIALVVVVGVGAVLYVGPLLDDSGRLATDVSQWGAAAVLYLATVVSHLAGYSAAAGSFTSDLDEHTGIFAATRPVRESSVILAKLIAVSALAGITYLVSLVVGLLACGLLAPPPLLGLDAPTREHVVTPFVLLAIGAYVCLAGIAASAFTVRRDHVLGSGLGFAVLPFALGLVACAFVSLPMDALLPARGGQDPTWHWPMILIAMAVTPFVVIYVTQVLTPLLEHRARQLRGWLAFILTPPAIALALAVVIGVPLALLRLMGR